MSERLKQLRAMFDEALDLEPQARRDFLLTAATGDRALVTEVEELLRHSEASDDSLVDSIGRLANDAIGGKPRRETIGKYRIVRELGRGGMGTVYLAERGDEAYRKQVAIKLVPTIFAREDLLLRFNAERQILASLEHPNIAHMLDGDTTRDGVPYVVMEYVEGLPIDEYCESRELDVRSRLQLFLRVLSAVSYAHANLIVHRDLKPGNILVTDEGEPKLLDFGIAKMLEAGAGAMPTRTAMRMMTPEYASPEQARGEPVNIASDVYSLGVLLAKVLTNALPYRLDTNERGALERAICEQPPRRPGDARSDVDSELDDIVLMALRKEPERRYSSVDALAEDIRRYLKGLPVSARPDTVTYRLRKYFERHLAGVAVTAAVTLAFGATIGFYTHRVADERDTARAEATKAQHVANLLEELIQTAGPAVAQGGSVPAEVLLSRSARQLRTELANEPELLAEQLAVIGRTWHSLDKFEEANALATEALELRKRTLNPNDPALAESYFDVGYYSIFRGQIDEAREMLERSLQIYEASSGEEPNAGMSATLRELSYVYDTLGRYDDARDAIERALPPLRQLFPDGSEEIAAALNVRGLVELRTRNLQAAVATLREVVELRERVYGDAHPLLASALQNAAFTHHAYGDLATAQEFLDRAIAMRIRLFGEDATQLQASWALLARILTDRGDIKGAEAAAERFEAITRRRFPDIGTRETNKRALDIVPKIYLMSRDYERAIGILQEQLATYGKYRETRAFEIVGMYEQLTTAWIGLGDAGSARASFEAASDLRPELESDSRWYWAELRRADIAALEGDVASALAAYEDVMAEQDEELPELSIERADNHLRLGRLYERAGRPDVARRHFERAAATFEATQVPESPRLADVRSALAAK